VKTDNSKYQMLKTIYLKNIIINIVLLFFFSCDAPRNNPLDPSNPDHIYHIIEGYVKTQDIVSDPINNAKIFWLSQNKIATTNSFGYYSIEIVGPQNGWLYCEKEGFWSDSTLIIWEQSPKKSIEYFLNSVASIDSLKIFSIILNRHGTFPTEKISVEVSVNDSEKDVDSVHVSIPFKQVRNMLKYNATEKMYTEVFSLYQLNILSVEELVGQIFNIEAKENLRLSQIIASGTLNRVISDEVEFISPANGATTTKTPILKWRNFYPGFPFTYILEIYTLETFPQLVWSKYGVSSDSSSYMVDSPLNIDEYWWVIWAVDEFGNRSRSKPASFRVE
jgi:hypothetical protein